MLPSLSAQEFVAKWSKATLKERSAAQDHFIDLCHLVGYDTPAEADPSGQTYTFEAGASKQRSGQGWADVWTRDFFAWEYKGKHKDLDQAYQQLLQYRQSLLDPPLLVVSDLEQILIHTNYTNTAKQIVRITLTNLYNQRPTWLDLAHRKLDEAVLDAYGWLHDLSDDETPARLLTLNLERAGE